MTTPYKGLGTPLFSTHQFCFCTAENGTILQVTHILNVHYFLYKPVCGLLVKGKLDPSRIKVINIFGLLN
jgi:hypothetical protein